jgi:hypothetical protein
MNYRLRADQIGQISLADARGSDRLVQYRLLTRAALIG